MPIEEKGATMAFEPTERRTSRVRTTTYRRRLFARQFLPHPRRGTRPLFSRRRGRWAATRLCFGAATVLLAAVVSSLQAFDRPGVTGSEAWRGSV